MYKLFDIYGKEVIHQNLQRKGFLCRSGATMEEVFVKLYGDQLNLVINPQKVSDSYVPNFYNTRNGLLADLKTQNTPFFQAETRFGLDPQYTVVFNGKDRNRYKSEYPDIEIYFAIDWQVVKFKGKITLEVSPMVGVWFINFGDLDKILDSAPFHKYLQRIDDKRGNVRESYLLNLLNPRFMKVI